MTSEQRMVLKVVIDRMTRQRIKRENRERVEAFKAYRREHGDTESRRRRVYSLEERAARRRFAQQRPRVRGKFVKAA